MTADSASVCPFQGPGNSGYTPTVCPVCDNKLGRCTLTTASQPSAWREPRYHCQNGSGDICLAGNKDGICCAADECDIDDGTRPDPRATAQPGEAGK